MMSGRTEVSGGITTGAVLRPRDRGKTLRPVKGGPHRASVRAVRGDGRPDGGPTSTDGVPTTPPPRGSPVVVALTWYRWVRRSVEIDTGQERKGRVERTRSTVG